MGNTNQTFRNRIINGAMMIDQRNSGASQTITSNATYYGVDRYRLGISGTNAYSLSVQQVTDAPSGFIYSQKYTVNTATTIASGDTFQTGQRIEYSNCSDLGWFDATSRYYVSTYTINSAGTWEQKTITVASPVAGGATATLSFWVKSSLTGTFSVLFATSPSPTITGTGLYICFDLGQGSTYQTSLPNVWGTVAYLSTTTSTRLMANSGATLQITGVQLEAGTTATPFELRSYGTELALCQRYFEMSYDIGTVPGTATTTGIRFFGMGISGATTGGGGIVFQIPKRSAPTIVTYDGAGTANNVSTVPTSSTTFTNGRAYTGAPFDISTNGFMNQGQGSVGNVYNFCHFTASAEL